MMTTGQVQTRAHLWKKILSENTKITICMIMTTILMMAVVMAAVPIVMLPGKSHPV